MQVVQKALNGLLVIEPRIFNDSRGLFYESFNQKLFSELSGNAQNFAQDNHSISLLNVIRGLHLQLPPHDQGKLVRVVAGKVLDVVVDIRNGSSTFGKSFSVELSSSNNLMLWIPPGFAHGFSVLENNSVFLYKCTKPFNKDSEKTILYSDSSLGIDWKINSPIVSEKDKEGILFSQFISPF